MNSLVKRNSNSSTYDPFLDFYNMEPFFPSFVGTKSFPSVNISEDDKNYCVDVVAPGFNKDDFKVNVENDMLTISAETRSEFGDSNEDKNEDKNVKNPNKNQENKNDSGSHDKRKYSRREYSYSSFTRSFRLPDNTKDDSISATYKDGILRLTIPKSKEEQKATKQIQIS